MSGIFKPGKQTNTSSSAVVMAPQQTQLLDLAMPYLTQFAKDGIKLQDGSSVAPFNSTQIAAQNSVLNNAATQQTGANNGMAASNFALNPNILNPNSNPALRGTINAATRPIFEGLTNSALPAIRSEATMTGNLGSSRQGIAEGLASKGAMDAAGDTSSKIAFSGYQSGLDTMMKSLGMLPQTLNAQNIPGASMGAVGDANQMLQQQLLDEAKARFLQKQTLPLDVGKEFVGLVGGVPSAGATTSSTTPTPSLFQTLLGTAATAAGAYAGAK